MNEARKEFTKSERVAIAQAIEAELGKRQGQRTDLKIVFENVIAALTLAEQFLNSTENVDEFNNLLKSSHRSLENGVIFWRAQEYGKAKEALSETGDGLGKDAVKHFLLAHAIPGTETLQNAIDSHYAECRQPNSAGGTLPIKKAWHPRRHYPPKSVTIVSPSYQIGV